MPVLHNAKKKLKQDKKRAIHNRKIKAQFRELIKAAKLGKKPDIISRAFSSIDRAAKHNIIHKNKAARMKASIAKITTPHKSA